MEIKHAALVLVDISGYTQFLKLRTISLLHAEEIISALLEAVIDRAEYPLVLNKLEGDAAFLYAVLGEQPEAAARDILRQVEGFFTAFHARAGELGLTGDPCTCDACTRLSDLKLKAVLHEGRVAFKRIRQFEELAGEDVILVHRLLKNSIPSQEYVAMTQAFAQLADPHGELPAESRTEKSPDLGSLRLKVLYPAPPPAAIPKATATEEFSFRQFVRRGLGRTLPLLGRLVGLRRGRNYAHLPAVSVNPVSFIVEVGEELRELWAGRKRPDGS